jgi:hypothetical protein
MADGSIHLRNSSQHRTPVDAPHKISLNCADAATLKETGAGIRGGCSCCFSIFDLYQARVTLDAAQRGHSWGSAVDATTGTMAGHVLINE